jgi:competence protein ComEA
MPRTVQPLVAAAVACALVGMAAWFMASGGPVGGLVHHDAAPGAAGGGFTVNLNAATATELSQLPGLGPATAARIVDHRRTHGDFVSVEGLLEVPGIGPATLELVRPHVRPIRPRTPGR